MTVHTLIIFPYNGFAASSPRGEMFWRIVDCCREAIPGPAPIVVVNRDTVEREGARSFLEDKRIKQYQLTVLRDWSVDTCQMWLNGWGHVIDAPSTNAEDRIVQLPGDIDSVSDPHKFLSHLDTFIDLTHCDIAIGDFSSGEAFNAKELIDVYGTYALMANWFPQVARGIHRLPLNRPRSEFLNIRVKVLRELLRFRKFAYEQTLNMLIRSWDFESDRGWRFKIKVETIGDLKDDSTSRHYRDCLDQIERTERMLKLLWREIAYGNRNEDSPEFIDLYDHLDRNSTSIRENARIIIRNVLGLGHQEGRRTNP